MCQVRLQVKYSLSGLDLRCTQPSHSWLFAARGAKPVEGDGEYPPTVSWRKNMQRRRKHPSALRPVKSMPRFRFSRGADAYALLNLSRRIRVSLRTAGRSRLRLRSSLQG